MFRKVASMNFFTRQITILFSVVFVICTFVMFTTPDAHAKLKLRISDGSSTVMVEDEDFGPTPPNTNPDEYLGSGVVTFSGSIGSFIINASVGTSKPVIGPGKLDLVVSVLSGDGGELMVEVTDTDYSDPANQGGAELEVGGLTEGSVSFSSFFDPNNVEFGTTTPGPSLGPLGPGGFHDSGTSSFSHTGTPYSLTIRAGISGSGYTGFDAFLQVLPGEDGYEGGTPGFWRNRFEDWVGVSPEDSFEEIFGVDASFAPPDDVLGEVIWLRGGGENALGRHAVAALLNALHPDINYLYTVDEVIQFVQDAYDTGNFNHYKDILEDQNKLPNDL